MNLGNLLANELVRDLKEWFPDRKWSVSISVAGIRAWDNTQCNNFEALLDAKLIATIPVPDLTIDLSVESVCRDLRRAVNGVLNEYEMGLVV